MAKKPKDAKAKDTKAKDTKAKEAKVKEAKPKEAKPKSKSKLGFDTSKIQQFLTARGERVGLAAAAALMVLLLFNSLWAAVSYRSAHTGLKKAVESLRGRIASADPQPGDIKMEDIGGQGYVRVSPMKFRFEAPLFDPGAVGVNKISNPRALPVGSLAKVSKDPDFQMDLVRAPVLQYRLDLRGIKVDTLVPNTAAAGAGGPAGSTGGFVPPPTSTGMDGQAGAGPLFAKSVAAQRLVVVSTTFPYEEQLKEFQRALRKESVAELQMIPRNMPRFVGLNVQRNVRDESGKWSGWEFLYGGKADDGTVFVSEHSQKVKDLLRLAPFDVKEAMKYRTQARPGLIMPMPALATGTYPEVKLEGIEIAQAPVDPNGTGEFPGGMPPGGGSASLPPGGGSSSFPGGAEGDPGMQQPATIAKYQIKPVALSTLQKTLKPVYDKLQGKFNPFDPLGLDRTAPADPNSPGGPPGYPGPSSSSSSSGGSASFPGDYYPGEGATPGEGGGVGPDGQPTAFNPYPAKLLVRFIDMDVEPGKSYAYSVQVRLANPNFGKQDKVIFRKMADDKEILSPYVNTPVIDVPPEGDLYVVDQMIVDPPKKDAPSVGVEMPSKRTLLPGQPPEDVPVQVHQWVKSFVKAKFSDTCGDWVIAERLMVRRGEFIARAPVPVMMPEWYAQNDGYVLPPDFFRPITTDKERSKAEKEAPTVRFLNTDPAPMVVDFKGGTKHGRSSKEVYDPLQALILTADGRLISRDSRTDSDPALARGQERLDRYREWRERIQKALPPPPMVPPGGGFPGGGDGGFPGGGGFPGSGCE